MLGPWIKAISCHMYHVAANAGVGEDRQERIEAMWLALVNHIQNVHHHENQLYPSCTHAPLPAEAPAKGWFIPGKICLS